MYVLLCLYVNSCVDMPCRKLSAPTATCNNYMFQQATCQSVHTTFTTCRHMDHKQTSSVVTHT